MIEGEAKLEISSEAVLDAMTRYLAGEIKSPVKATKFEYQSAQYPATGFTAVVTFEALKETEHVG